jgi:DNA-binding transcriptional LysR family regulator
MIAVPVGPKLQRLALASSQSYLKQRGITSHPQEPLDHDCIRLRHSSGAIVEWEFEKDGELIVVDPPGRLIIGVDGAAAAMELVRS